MQNDTKSQPAGVIGGDHFVGPVRYKVCGKCKQTQEITKFSWNTVSEKRASTCKSCATEASRVWRLNNPDKLKAQYEIRKKAYAENPEKVKEQAKAWYRANTDKSRVTKKAWYEANFARVQELDRLRRSNFPEKFREWARQWRANNPERSRAHRRKWKKSNPDRVKTVNKVWVQKNKRSVLEKQSAWVKAHPERVRAISKRWRDANPDKCAQAANRRRVSIREPAWASRIEISRLYREARRLTVATGIPHEVDHIYPIKGKTVSGLHTHENLRVIKLFTNRSKGAKLPGDRASELWNPTSAEVFYG